MAPELKPGSDLVVGVSKLAWMYGRSRPWAERLLTEWWEKQANGGPIKVFRHGVRGSLYTTMAVLNQMMPPGRDLALYRRVEVLESDVSDIHRRVDRETAERKLAVGDLDRRVGRIEGERRRAG